MRESNYILDLESKLIFQHSIARCFNLKTGQKVLLFNYCLKNDSGSFLVKKIVRKGYYKNEVLILA